MLLVNEAKTLNVLLLDDQGNPTSGTITFDIYDETNSLFTSGTMSPTGTTGLYTLSFTPDAQGLWSVLLECTDPNRHALKTYEVGRGIEQAIKDKTDNLPNNPAPANEYDVQLDQSLSTTESNIRGADNDTLKTLSDQMDGIEDCIETQPFEYSLFWDRMCWVSFSTDDEKKEYLRKLGYHGRGGIFSCWWDSEVGDQWQDWHLPLNTVGVNSNESSPWNNAIHLRNSQDGTIVDQIYFAPRVEPRERWLMRVDYKCPTLASLPSGASDLYIGFEVPFQGGNAIYCIKIGKSKVSLVSVTTKEDGTVEGRESADFSSWFATGSWKTCWLVLDPPHFRATDQSNTVGLEILETGFYPKVAPFFANEATLVVDDFYIGQFAVWPIEPSLKPETTIIDESTISPGGEVHYDLDLADTAEISLTTSVTYGASATQGIRVYLLASNNDFSLIDSENTDDAFTYFEPSFSQGNTRVKTVIVDSIPRFIRVLVRNLDGSNGQGAVKVRLTRKKGGG
ncbi:MAG: hypothetical protein ACTSR2_03580 [Candidatus Hodarchaeales archaeon]